MSDIDEFLAANPRSRRIREYTAEELERLNDERIPADVRDFLRAEGAASFHDDFFWTTLPDEQRESLKVWGLDSNGCTAFLRTALGSICYVRRGKVGRLDPVSGYAYPGRHDFREFMNVVLTMDVIWESMYFDIYQQKKTERPLEYDEIYGLVPALPLGGSVTTSRLEVVKMREHLSILAQLFGNKARKI